MNPHAALRSERTPRLARLGRSIADLGPRQIGTAVAAGIAAIGTAVLGALAAAGPRPALVPIPVRARRRNPDGRQF